MNLLACFLFWIGVSSGQNHELQSQNILIKLHWCQKLAWRFLACHLTSPSLNFLTYKKMGIFYQPM